MAISREELKQALGQLPVLDMVELIKELEEEWGVSAAAPVMAAAAPAVAGAGDEAAEEKTEFDVMLTGFGDNKIAVIKAVRAATSLGLKEAKELVESVPVALKEGVNKEQASELEKQLQEAGATVEIK